ncbi:MAG: hypothetical protein K6G73_12495 [Marinilabiliaceae bacterium]|nr:hypothetical protein [Marinilabiliaceae bacterium]
MKSRGSKSQNITMLKGEFGSVCTVESDNKTWYRVQDVSNIFNGSRDVSYFVKTICIPRGLRNFFIDGHRTRFADIDNIERLVRALKGKNVLEFINWLQQKPKEQKEEEKIPLTADELIAMEKEVSISKIKNLSCRNMPRDSQDCDYAISLNYRYTICK